MNRLRGWLSGVTWSRVCSYNLAGNRRWNYLGDFAFMVPPRPSIHDRPQPADPAMRTELIARIRREIQAGCYDTPEKFAIAMERMLGIVCEKMDPPSYPPHPTSES